MQNNNITYETFRLLKLVCTEVLDEGLRHFNLHYEGDLEDILNQFSKADLVGVVAVILSVRKDSSFTSAVIKDLHAKKYNRIVSVMNTQNAEYNTKYRRYEDFLKKVKNTEKAFNDQRKIMIDLGLITERKVDGEDKDE